MPPILRSKRSNTGQESKPKIKLEHVLSNIIRQGMKKMGEPSPDDVQVLEEARNLAYSSTSISSDQEENSAAPQQANRRVGIIYSNESADQTQKLVMDFYSGTDLNGLEPVASVSVSNNPFENFLQDISVAHGTRPVDNMQEAFDKWLEMTPRQKEVFQAENYVLKLFNEVGNRDDIYKAVGFHPDEDFPKGVANERPQEQKPKVKAQTNLNKSTQVLRKPVKRLKTKAREVVTPKKSPKQQGASSVPVRRKNSAPAYKNFLRKILQSNPGLLAVEAATLWRKMVPVEKDFYRVSSSDRLKKAEEVKSEAHKPVRSKTKNVLKLPKPRPQGRKRKTTRSTQAPKDAFVDSESDSAVAGGQLQVCTGNISESEGSRLSWPRFEYIAKAIDKVKHLFL
ncbi:uncharacterized protein LOC108033379 [Drosophila biarmipes]|uniref:uncharacterized protein LOC108033379 n=1 Tax=Drosophila biarmipes TaxID=125945 RepID=UPI0007E881AA|nr:uncharacterized protein LOC108033379 [Drosophila biarmipes]